MKQDIILTFPDNNHTNSREVALNNDTDNSTVAKKVVTFLQS